MLTSRLLVVFLLASPALPQIRKGSGPAGLTSTPAPALTERALFELQKDADRIYTALEAVHVDAQSGATNAATRPAKQAIVADLRGVLTQLEPDTSDWSALSARLKQLRRERADGAVGGRERADLNARIYALQMRAAYIQLMGELPLASPSLRRNAALWSLVGAYNSAAAGRAEAGWREGQDRAEIVFGDGRAVVFSRRWRNAHTLLDAAARHARNGRPEQAAAGFTEAASLLRLTPTVDAEHLARHRKAAALLDAAAIAAREGEDGAALTARAEHSKTLIPHPKLADPTALSSQVLEAAARAQAAVDSAKVEYLAVLAQETALTRWVETLAGPRPSAADRAAARVDFQEAYAWAERGFVGPKQIAAQELAAALASLDRGEDVLAARHAGWARDELTQRLADLERIGSKLRARIARLSSRLPGSR